MKTKTEVNVPLAGPTEDDIRDYAYHLYLQSGSVAGHELDNWLEATACLSACIPKDQSHNRLRRHTGAHSTAA
jgi:hypothetical protein